MSTIIYKLLAAVHVATTTLLLLLVVGWLNQVQAETQNEARGVQLELASPGNRLVYQRDDAGGANIPLKGNCTLAGASIEARFSSIGSPGKVITASLGKVASDGTFSGKVRVGAGWYSLQVQARQRGEVIAMKLLDRVGVGEVFIVMGHSVAQGGELNLPGSVDDRVQTIALSEEQIKVYEKTVTPGDLPDLVGAHFGSGVKPAPFGHGTYFWARFAEELAKRETVPVLLLNAGFGGTSLGHWAKSASGEGFEHSFVRSDLQMPYANLRNALQKYAKHVGLRAILSDHGQNDAGETKSDLIFQNYSNVIAQARADLGFPDLAVVVNHQTPYGTIKHIRQVQERVIREIPHIFPGPDYDTLQAEDRPDRIHLGKTGMEKAAAMWAAALDQTFFKRSKPFIPKPQ